MKEKYLLGLAIYMGLFYLNPGIANAQGPDPASECRRDIRAAYHRAEQAIAALNHTCYEGSARCFIALLSNHDMNSTLESDYVTLTAKYLGSEPDYTGCVAELNDDGNPLSQLAHTALWEAGKEAANGTPIAATQPTTAKTSTGDSNNYLPPAITAPVY